MRRKCSECPELLPEGSKKLTHNAACRQKRARRIKKQQRAAGLASAAARGMTEDQKAALEDTAHEVMAEELRPVIREALTEDAMQSLKKMVGLLPATIDALAEDITAKDDLVRQKAHTLVLRYTLGHEKALPDEAPGAGLTIINSMPRPDSTPPEPLPAEATEIRTCDICEEDKPASEFVGESSRCAGCMEKLQSKVTKFLGEGAGG